MSISKFNPAAAAPAVGQSHARNDAPSAAKDSIPKFSRADKGADTKGLPLPKLSEGTQVNGKIPRYEFLESGMVGDLMRTVRDVGSGNVHAAAARLDVLAGIDASSFYKERKIDPALVGNLQKAIQTHADPKALLAAVYDILDKSGAAALSPKLRPAAPKIG